MSDSRGRWNFAGSLATSAARSAFGKANPMICSSAEMAR
jgi:hypothetical protein